MYPVFIMNIHSKKVIPFDCPATYRITVQGRIDPTWTNRLEGMKVSLASGDDGPPVTTLAGELIDQAALAGVLNTIYELHLLVLSVKRLDV